MKKRLANQWSIAEIWNNLVADSVPITPRDYIRASELGYPYLDRFLKMKGVRFTNPFTPRVLRVFDTGRVFETEVVERIFKLLGILIESQTEVYIQKNNYLPVIGHHDPKVGGMIKKDQALINLASPSLPEWMKLRSLTLLEKLLKAYPRGMKILTTEIKSVNSRVFWSKKHQDPITGFFKGYDHHKLQLWTYLQTDRSEGRFFYISKDDLTLMESNLSYNDKKIEALWNEDVSQMTHYFKKNITPPPESFIVWNELDQQFEMNWRIERSNYFTKITRCNTVEDWYKKYATELKKKNTQKCNKCGKPFSLQTLNKNKGVCGRCINGGEVKQNGKKSK